MPINSFRRSSSESGQVLLVVVLVAVISLTVGLAAISRSITNTRVSTEESNSQKALSAAEAGLEQQLKKAKELSFTDFDRDIPGDLTGDSKYTAKVQKIAGPIVIINSGVVPVSKTEGADVWLSDYPNFDNPLDRTIQVFWKDESANCNNNAAIEIVILRGADKTAGAKNDPILERYAYDACDSRNNSNKFTDAVDIPSPGITLTDKNKNSATFNRRTNDIVIANGYIVRIIPIYHDTKIGVRVNSGQDLPAQGFNIESTGTSGETQRKVKVFQSFPTVPIEIFPYNLFNP